MRVKPTTITREYAMTFTNTEIAAKLFDATEILGEALDNWNDDISTMNARRSVMSALSSLIKAKSRLYRVSQSKRILESYGDMCVDCDWPIPTNVLDGVACENCGHVFYDPLLYRDDDEPTE